jgi:hypothetical protein
MSKLSDPYRRQRFRNHGIYAPIRQREDEGLTGFVQGKDASDLEERFYRSAIKDSRITRIRFRKILGAPSRSMFGSAELDYLLFAGHHIAVAVDGERWHSQMSAILKDLRQDDIILHGLRRLGVDRVQHIRGRHLETQDLAERTLEQLLGGRIFTHYS